MYYGGNAITQAYLNGDHFLPIGEKPIIYGFAVDETVSDPYNAVTYIEDSVNFTPATMTDGVFDGGSWLDVYPFNSVKPCVINSDGSLDSYLNPNNFLQYEDGTDFYLSRRTMIEIPTVYWKFTKTTNGYEVRFSDTQIDSSYQALAHSRGDTLKGNLYIGAFEGTINNGILISRSNENPTLSTTLSDFRAAANAVGSGFELMNFHSWTLLQILFVAMFKSLDSQSSLGYGISGNDYWKPTGTTVSNGMYYGTTADQTTGVKFMGIENIFGNTNTWLDGIHLGASNVYISDNTSFSDDGYGYQYSVSTTNLNSTYGNMSSALGKNIGGFLATSANGSSTTYYCDATLGYGAASTACLMRVGGSYTNTTECGMFCSYSTGVGQTHAKTGARLQYLAP